MESNDTRFSAMLTSALNKAVAPLAAELAAIKDEKRRDQVARPMVLPYHGT